MKKAADILIDCVAMIDDRGTERDQPGGERSMARTVAGFNGLTGHKLSEGDGWLFMQCLKSARSKGGGFKADDYVDKVAYAALEAEYELTEHVNYAGQEPEPPEDGFEFDPDDDLHPEAGLPEPTLGGGI